MNRKIIQFGYGPRVGEVGYLVIGGAVYFTQVDGPALTINNAEVVIQAISEAENIKWSEYKWIDIQTTEFFSMDDTCLLEFADAEKLNVTDWITCEPPISEEILRIVLEK